MADGKETEVNQENLFKAGARIGAFGSFVSAGPAFVATWVATGSFLVAMLTGLAVLFGMGAILNALKSYTLAIISKE